MHRKEDRRRSWRAALAWAKRKARELNEPIFIYLDHFDEFDEPLPKPIYRFIRERSYFGPAGEEIIEANVQALVNPEGWWEEFSAGGDTEFHDR